MDKSEIKLIGMSPAIEDKSGKDYFEELASVSGWADDDGWEGILVYTDHIHSDPWLVSQVILQNTKRLCPLVATQPVYMHPFSAAKMIATLASFHGRQIYVNMVAGGFPRDLAALGDTTPHDRRYDRVREYALIMRDLLSKGVSSFAGDFYTVKDLQLRPLPPHLQPVFTMSGSSNAGLAVAKEIGARSIQYLRPIHEYAGVTLDPQVAHGTRLGIVVRESSEEAWSVAKQRYPENIDAQELRELATELSDSVWVKELGREIQVPSGHPYWIGPYKNAYVPCPFLVGSFNEVATELASYLRMGFRTFLLDIPTDREDSKRMTRVFEQARVLCQPT